MKARSAFTLIELVVVIIIIAVASAVLTPAYSRYLSHAQFDEKAEQVRNLFAWARQQALETGTQCTISLDDGGRSITATSQPGSQISDLPAVDANTTGSASALNQQTQTLPPVKRSVDLSKGYTMPQFMVEQESQFVSQPPSNGGPPQTSSASQIAFYTDGTSDYATVSLSGASGFRSQWTLWPPTGELLTGQVQ